MKYRKKSIIVEAMQWDGGIMTRNELGEWLGDLFLTHDEYNHPHLITLNGDVRLDLGDWIIKGEGDNDYYPCKPDIFERTYDKVDELKQNTSVSEDAVKTSEAYKPIPAITEKEILHLLRLNFDPYYDKKLYGKGKEEIKCEVLANLLATVLLNERECTRREMILEIAEFHRRESDRLVKIKKDKKIDSQMRSVVVGRLLALQEMWDKLYYPNLWDSFIEDFKGLAELKEGR